MSITSRYDRGRRIYVASHFYMWQEVRYWYYELEQAGHQITYEWARKDAPGNLPEDRLTDEILREAAVRYLVGVEDADLFLFLANDDRMLGAPIEAGYALAKARAEIWVVDPYRRCPFFLLPGVTIATRAEAARRLGFEYTDYREHTHGGSSPQTRV